MKHAYVALFIILLIAGSALVSGCVSQALDMRNATYGKSFYDFNNVHYWEDNVVMTANGTSSSWNMTVYVKNVTYNDKPALYLQVVTVGNGMNITYDVWSDPATYNVLKMHANGTIGNYSQDKDTSVLQIDTLPDVGLTFYYVPFWPVANTTARMANGNTIPVTIYSVTDNMGNSLSYMIYKGSPVPLKVEISQQTYKMEQTLIALG